MKLSHCLAGTVLLWACGTAVAAAYEIGADLVLEAVHNTRGGLARGGAELASLSASVSLDTAQADLWHGGEWFVSALANAGDNPSDWTGDVQGISNIAAPRAAKIYELWYQHSFSDDQLQLLLGLHDYNALFYALDSAGLFTHASFGIGPDTSQVGPSIFPTTSLGLVASGNHQSLYWQMAVYDGVPGDPENPRGTQIHLNSEDGVFAGFEWGMREPEVYKWGLGYWYHSAQFEEPVYGETLDDNAGIYALAERYLGDHWAVFAQLGYARAHYNRLRRYLGAGVTYADLIKAGDQLGLGLARAQLDSQFRRENPDLARAEEALECTYFVPVLQHLGAQASVYYIRNPGFDPNLDETLALGLRVLLEY